jgi:hypothetical protein
MRELRGGGGFTRLRRGRECIVRTYLLLLNLNENSRDVGEFELRGRGKEKNGFKSYANLVAFWAIR